MVAVALVIAEAFIPVVITFARFTMVLLSVIRLGPAILSARIIRPDAFLSSCLCLRFDGLVLILVLVIGLVDNYLGKTCSQQSFLDGFAVHIDVNEETAIFVALVFIKLQRDLLSLSEASSW